MAQSKYRRMVSIPFPGNKKSSYKRVKQIFENGPYINVVEPFAGSGVLSVNLKRDGLAENAYINDYDGLFNIYPEFLDKKDWLVKKCKSKGLRRRSWNKERCRKYLNDDETEFEIVDTRTLNEEERGILQKYIAMIDKKFWRLLAMGCNFAHSGVAQHEEITLKDFSYFGGRLETTYGREYMEWVNQCVVDSMDWKDYIPLYLPYAGLSDALVILDPPYFGTQSKGYGGEMDERETMELLYRLRPYKVDFLFFNGDDEWMATALEQAGYTDYEIEPIGCSNNTVNHKRREYLAYVKGGANGNG